MSMALTLLAALEALLNWLSERMRANERADLVKAGEDAALASELTIINEIADAQSEVQPHPGGPLAIAERLRRDAAAHADAGPASGDAPRRS